MAGAIAVCALGALASAPPAFPPGPAAGAFALPGGAAAFPCPSFAGPPANLLVDGERSGAIDSLDDGAFALGLATLEVDGRDASFSAMTTAFGARPAIDVADSASAVEGIFGAIAVVARAAPDL